MLDLVSIFFVKTLFLYVETIVYDMYFSLISYFYLHDLSSIIYLYLNCLSFVSYYSSSKVPAQIIVKLTVTSGRKIRVVTNGIRALG